MRGRSLAWSGCQRSSPWMADEPGALEVVGSNPTDPTILRGKTNSGRTFLLYPSLKECSSNAITYKRT